MISEYRKRFVISTMLMVSLVLLAGFIALSVSGYRSEYSSLMNTMEQVLRPIDYARGGFQIFDRRRCDVCSWSVRDPDGNGKTRNHTRGAF